MSLSTALANAQSGLTATQRQVAAASDNIANAQTPGYTTKVARITANNTAGVGNGVSATIERQAVDSILLRDVRFEAARLGTLDVRAAATQRLSDVSGTPGDERSLAAGFTSLETAFQTLFDAPERTDLQRQVFFAANELVTKFDSAQSTIKTAREEADRNIEASVRVVNEALEGIQFLNGRVAEWVSDPRIDISGVLDERDRLLDTISEQIGIRTFARDNGELVISTTEGVTLLDGQARELTFARTPAIDAAARIDSIPPGLSGLQVDGFNIEPGPASGSQALRTGAIAGYFLARDVDLVGYQDQIDALAKETVVLFQQADTQVAALRAGAFSGGLEAPVDVPGLFTDAGASVDPAATATDIIGLAGRLNLNALVDPDQGGDLSRLRTGVVATFRADAAEVDFSGPTPVPTLTPAYTNPGAAQLTGFSGQIEDFLTGLSEDRDFAINGGLSSVVSLQRFASEFATNLQSSRVTFENDADRTRTIFETLDFRRLNENGVNIDEESERLLELEQAFSANAQVINIIARMFDELLQRIA